MSTPCHHCGRDDPITGKCEYNPIKMVFEDESWKDASKRETGKMQLLSKRETIVKTRNESKKKLEARRKKKDDQKLKSNGEEKEFKFITVKKN